MAENGKGISHPLFDMINQPGDNRKRLLMALVMTKSFVTLENLRGVLSEDLYQQLELALRADAERFFRRVDHTRFTEEQIEEGKKSRMNRDLLFDQGKGGRIQLQEVLYVEGDFDFPVNPESVNELELAKLVERAMEEHLSYGRFHSTGALSDKEVPEALKYYIDVAREIQGKELKYQEQEKPVERASEEQELIALSARKKELEEELVRIGQQIAAAKAKEEQIRGGQEKEGKPEQEDEGR